MQIDVVLEIYAKNTFQKQVYFCYWLYVCYATDGLFWLNLYVLISTDFVDMLLAVK